MIYKKTALVELERFASILKEVFTVYPTVKQKFNSVLGLLALKVSDFKLNIINIQLIIVHFPFVKHYFRKGSIFSKNS